MLDRQPCPQLSISLTPRQRPGFFGLGAPPLRDTVTFQGDVRFPRPNDVAACLFSVPPACPPGVIRLLHPPCPSPLPPATLPALPLSLPPLTPTPSPNLTSVRLRVPSLTPFARRSSGGKFRTRGSLAGSRDLRDDLRERMADDASVAG